MKLLVAMWKALGVFVVLGAFVVGEVWLFNFLFDEFGVFGPIGALSFVVFAMATAVFYSK